jgi:hypothetical protein
MNFTVSIPQLLFQIIIDNSSALNCCAAVIKRTSGRSLL